MADLPSDTPNDDTAREPHQGSTTPRWVKMFAIVIVVLVMTFVVLHLTGHGFGGHTPFPSGTQQPGP